MFYQLLPSDNPLTALPVGLDNRVCVCVFNDRSHNFCASTFIYMEICEFLYQINRRYSYASFLFFGGGGS